MSAALFLLAIAAAGAACVCAHRLDNLAAKRIRARASLRLNLLSGVLR